MDHFLYIKKILSSHFIPTSTPVAAGPHTVFRTYRVGTDAFRIFLTGNPAIKVLRAIFIFKELSNLRLDTHVMSRERRK